MSKRPYFISNDDFSDKLGLYALLSSELNERIRDILTPILSVFNSYMYSSLLNNYQRISVVPRYVDAGNLPISNYDPISTWEKILRIGIEIVDRSVIVNEEIILKALFETMELMGFQQKVGYYSLKQLASAQEQSVIDDRLRLMLIYYHDLYDGEYKIALSFFHLTCEILSGKFDEKKTFKDYLSEDVSYKLIKLKELSESIKLAHNLEWLLLGADNHIRNAIAHKNWHFADGKVKLWDKSGWSLILSEIELEDLIKKITIAILAIEASLIIVLSKYQKQMRPYIKNKEYDFESIHTVMYHYAEDQGFILDDLLIIGKEKLRCILINKPKPHGPSELIMKNGPLIVKTTIPPASARSERALGFAFNSLSMLHSYEELEIVLKNFKQENKGTLIVNLRRWIEIAGQDNPSKIEYDSDVKRAEISDD